MADKSRNPQVKEEIPLTSNENINDFFLIINTSKLPICTLSSNYLTISY